MKIRQEKIQPSSLGTSFHWLINPKLNDFYFWHFHAEYELIFIEASKGNRHVGTHMQQFEDFDFVLIGSYIPHLNFDYGIKTEYQKTVLHINPSFLETISIKNTPELRAIANLFEMSKYGIAFGKESKTKLGQQFKRINTLNNFDQYIEILKLLNELANATDQKYLHADVPKTIYNQKEKDKLEDVFRFIDLNFQRKMPLSEAAEICNLSNAAFCRYFKKMTKLSFTEFVNHLRITESKRMLIANKNVSEACFECGFESLSYFNRTFKRIVGQNPSTFRYSNSL